MSNHRNASLPTASSVRQATLEVGPAGAVRLLVVTADHLERVALQRMIVRDGLPYACVFASSVSQARAHLDGMTADVIVADYRLPDGSAIDVRSKRAEAPFIIMADQPDEDMVIAASHSAFTSHVVRTPDRGHLAALPFAIGAALRLASAERQLRRLSRAIQAVGDAVFVCDRFGRIEFVNAAFSALYGYSSEEIVGQLASVLVPEGATLEECAEDPSPQHARETDHVHKTGARLPISISRTARATEAEGTMYVARDLSERRALEARLQHATAALEALETLATTDGLTGLSNRRELDRQLTEELQRSTRTGQPLGVLMIDADHFKSINDVHGHGAGDDVLRGLARTVKEHLRSIDRVARYGGEELTVLLPDTGLAGALVVAERLRAAIAEQVFAVRSQKDGPTALNVTVSIGVAAREGEFRTPDALLGLADEGLYQAKHGGRNRTVGVK
jgi:diguanylate cyclase (GGDEF)-like protein/PAS domain S-box-containing protein